MTARDEAIRAMVKARSAKRRDTLLCDLLDAIPAGVLARLAIERGGLHATDYGGVHGADVWLQDAETGAELNLWPTLYRLEGTDQ